ncbi:MAG: DNA-directed RNA polymerase subunit delta [Alicyclobacillaceae bacterium]|nr:DNA-directed RNA polymerase subunit delta [Alicyclobacillaceae bacterium]
MAEEAAVQWDPEVLEEISFVDLAYEVLRQGGTPVHYRDLLADVAQLKGLSDEELEEIVARLYTDINVDGRFLHLGGNVWGLKRWYPTDKTADRAMGQKAAVRDDEDEDDLLLDEELEEQEELLDDEVEDVDDEYGDEVVDDEELDMDELEEEDFVDYDEGEEDY